MLSSLAVLLYIDPGTGSIILQAVLAGLLGALFVVKTYWIKIKRGFKAVLGRSSAPKDADR